MASVLLYWLPLLLVPLIAQFLFAPFIIRFKNSMAAYPQFVPVAAESLPPGVAQNFALFVQAMFVEGFALVGYLYQSNPTPNTTLFMAVMKRAETADMACLADITATSAGVSRHSLAAEVCTDLEDGTEINTNNFQYASAFKANPQKKLFRLPEVRNPRSLYHLHRQLRQRCAPNAKGVLPDEGRDLFHLSNSMTREMRKQVEFGYYFLDETNEVFRPTWKGAFIMTWKLAWPVGAIRKVWMKRKARTIIRSLSPSAPLMK
jgi:hypothetical protein